MKQSITKQLTAIKWWNGIIGKLDKNWEREEDKKEKRWTTTRRRMTIKKKLQPTK